MTPTATRHVYRRRGPELSGPLLPPTAQCGHCRAPATLNPRGDGYVCSVAGAAHLDRQVGDVDSALTAAVIRYTERTTPGALEATVSAWGSLPAHVLATLAQRMFTVVVPRRGPVEVYPIGAVPAMLSGLAKCGKCRSRAWATADHEHYECSRWDSHHLGPREATDSRVLDILAERITRPDMQPDTPPSSVREMLDIPQSWVFVQWVVGKMFTPILAPLGDDTYGPDGVGVEWRVGMEWDAEAYQEMREWQFQYPRYQGSGYLADPES